jgi:antirestriction protein ArdC
VTFFQAQKLGGYVKRGERSSPVIFWEWLDVENKETATSERIPFMRFFNVFNTAQCEGVPVPELTQTVREHSPIQAAEQIVAGMPQRPEIKQGMNRAFYSPSSDFVGMPAADQFKADADYYSVLFHELAHSTGHESRLNRKGVSRTDGQLAAFGSDPYAKEELVAETAFPPVAELSVGASSGSDSDCALTVSRLLLASSIRLVETAFAQRLAVAIESERRLWSNVGTGAGFGLLSDPRGMEKFCHQ